MWLTHLDVIQHAAVIRCYLLSHASDLVSAFGSGEEGEEKEEEEEEEEGEVEAEGVPVLLEWAEMRDYLQVIRVTDTPFTYARDH